MRSLLATTFTVLAVSGCAAAPAATDSIDEEPPPSSRQPVRQVAHSVATPITKDFDLTKPGDPRPTATSESACGGPWPPPTDAWPDGDPKSDPDFAPDFPGGPSGERDPGSDCVGFPTPPTGFVEL
jgi:hypothetical protein